jgi:hypothetical protein
LAVKKGDTTTIVVAELCEDNAVGGPTPYREDEEDLVELGKTFRNVVEDHDRERHTECRSNAIKEDVIG